MKNFLVGTLLIFLALPLVWFGLPLLLPHGRDKASDYVIIGPTFLVPICVGWLCGIVTNRRARDYGGSWCWLVPLALLAYTIFEWLKQPTPNGWHSLVDNFFTARCSDSECLYELITANFACSVAYSLGALYSARKWIRGDRPEPPVAVIQT